MDFSHRSHGRRSKQRPWETETREYDDFTDDGSDDLEDSGGAASEGVDVVFEPGRSRARDVTVRLALDLVEDRSDEREELARLRRLGRYHKMPSLLPAAHVDAAGPLDLANFDLLVEMAEAHLACGDYTKLAWLRDADADFVTTAHDLSEHRIDFSRFYWGLVLTGLDPLRAGPDFSRFYWGLMLTGPFPLHAGLDNLGDPDPTAEARDGDQSDQLEKRADAHYERWLRSCVIEHAQHLKLPSYRVRRALYSSLARR